MLAAAGGLSIAGLTGPTVAVTATAASIAGAAHGAVTVEGVVAALEGAYGIHKGQRRNHAKGAGPLGI